MTDEQKKLWEQINNDIEYLYTHLRNLPYEHLDVLDSLMVNRNTLNGLINEAWVKVILTEKGIARYKERNGFWESNFDEQGYSIFSGKYFDEVFNGMGVSEITEHEIIHFYK